MIRNENWKLTTDEAIDWTEYPRPQMKRDSYFSLNGVWKLNDEDIRIPFPPQSDLSRYKKSVGKHMNYIKRFTLPNNL
jgi:hypothetical protein